MDPPRIAAVLRRAMDRGRWGVVGEHRWGRGVYARTMVGTRMVDWLLAHAPETTTRPEAAAAWQALAEHALVTPVGEDVEFVDKPVLYRWAAAIERWEDRSMGEDSLATAVRGLLALGPDAHFRATLLKPYWTRTPAEIQRIWEELNLLKALGHLSTMLKRQLASVISLEVHAHAGAVLFRQGDPGNSWFIILKGSVDVVIFGKGVVCSLHEGDDFGKLALVNDSPRAATIITREDNSHFLRVDKDHFDRILRDVEANTVRLREYGTDVLVLEKIPVSFAASPSTHPRDHRYSVMAGRGAKILEYLLETRMDIPSTSSDTLLEDFLLTHPLFCPSQDLAEELTKYYFQDKKGTVNGGRHLAALHKRRVVKFVRAWVEVVGERFFQDCVANAFIKELYSSVVEDTGFLDLRGELETLMRLREEAMAAAARPPFLVLHTGLLTPPDPSHSPADPVRSHDLCILRVYTLSGSFVSLQMGLEKTAMDIVRATRTSLHFPLDTLSSMRLVEVKSSGERVIWGADERCIGSRLSLNGRLWLCREEEVTGLSVLEEQLGPGESVHAETLLLLTSSQTAARLALSHSHLLQATHELELLNELFRVPSWPLPVNLHLLVRAFNSLHYAVPTEILLAPTPHKRLLLLNKFIKIAAYCKFHQDILGEFAIVLGLSNPAISRLQDLWTRVPRKLRRKLGDMESELEPSRNHRAYRQLLSSLSPPIVPFIPLLLKDLSFVHQGNKTFFDSLVNFEKMHMVADILRHFRHCKSKSFEVSSCDPRSAIDAQQIVRNFKVIDNQCELDALSRVIEPPRFFHPSPILSHVLNPS